MIEIDYTNWKGERSKRLIIPKWIKYEPDNKYHGSCFVLTAFDKEKKEYRSFKLNDIHNPEVLKNVAFFISSDYQRI